MKTVNIAIMLIVVSLFASATITDFSATGNIDRSMNIEMTTDSQLFLKYELRDNNGRTVVENIIGPSQNHEFSFLELSNADYKLFLTTFEENENNPSDIIFGYDFTYNNNLNLSIDEEYSGFVNGIDFGVNQIQREEDTVESQDEPTNQVEEVPTTSFFTDNEDTNTDASQSVSTVNVASGDKISNLEITPGVNDLRLKFNTWTQSRVIISYQPEFYEVRKVFSQGADSYEIGLSDLFSNTKYNIEIEACDLLNEDDCETVSSEVNTLSTGTGSDTADFEYDYINVNGTIGKFLILNVTGEPGTKITVYKNRNFDLALYEQLRLQAGVIIGNNGSEELRYKNEKAGPVTFTILSENNERISSSEFTVNVTLEGPGLQVGAIPPLAVKVFNVSGIVNNPSDILIKANNETLAYYRADDLFFHGFDFSQIIDIEQEELQRDVRNQTQIQQRSLNEQIKNLEVLAKERQGNAGEVYEINDQIDELKDQLSDTRKVDPSKLRVSRSEPVNLEFIARDDFGTIEIIEYVLIIDDQPPELQFDDNIEAIMDGREEVLFPILNIKGNAGEPFAKLIVVNEGDGTNTVSEFVFDASKEPVLYTQLNDGKILQTINEEYLDFEVQTFEELRGGTVADDIAVRLKDYIERNQRKDPQNDEISAYAYIDLSLSQQLRKWITPIQESETNLFEVVADENGNFDFNIVLLGGEDPNQASLNKINILAIDPAGNAVYNQYPVKFIRGTSLWTSRPGEQFPVSLTVTDLKDTGVDAVLHYELQYNGPSSDRLTNVKVSSARKTDRSPNSKYYNFGGRVLSKYNKDDGTLFVEIPVRFNKLPKDLEVFSLPDQIDLRGMITVTASIDDPDLDPEIVAQISSGRVGVKSSMAIEKPWETRKWLNPELVKKGLNILNKTHNFLQEAIDKTKKIATANTAACGLYSFFGSFVNVNLESFYFVCDRVACPFVPSKCEELAVVENAEYATKYYKNDDIGDNLRVSLIENPGDDATEKQNANNFLRQLNYQGNLPECEDGQNIIVRRSEVSKVDVRGAEKGHPLLNKVFNTDIQTEARCADVSRQEFEESDFSFQPTGNEICWSNQAPQYDNIKCFDNSYSGEPANNLLSSLRCGCISGVVGNLQKYDRIVNMMNRCLREVQLGRIEGAACEEIFSVYICDVLATGFSKIKQQPKKVINQNDNGARSSTVGGIATDSIQKSQTISKFFNDRYTGSGVNTRFSLNSDQLVNKLCIAAVSGNYDDLSAVFESSLNINVPPSYFLVGARSRLHSFSKISRSMNIKYDVTPVIISGGRNVKYRVELQCDKDFSNGEYCPSNIDQPKGKLAIRSGTLAKNTDLDTRVSYVDKGAKFWYNKAVLHISYKDQNEEVGKSIVKDISRSGDIHFECSFSIDGFRCGGFDGIEVGDVKVKGSPARGIRFEPSGFNVFYNGQVVKAAVELETIGYSANDLFVKVEQLIPDGYEGPTIIETNPMSIKIPSVPVTGEDKFVFDIGRIPQARSEEDNRITDKWRFVMQAGDRDTSQDPNAITRNLFRNERVIQALGIQANEDITEWKLTQLKVIPGSASVDGIGQASLSLNNKVEFFNGREETSFSELDIVASALDLRVEDIRLTNPSVPSASLVMQMVFEHPSEGRKSVTITEDLQFNGFQTSKTFKQQNLEFKISLARDVDGNGVIDETSGDEIIEVQEGSTAKRQEFTLRAKWNPRDRTASDCLSIKPQVSFETIETGDTLCLGSSDKVYISTYHVCDDLIDKTGAEAKFKLRIGTRAFESENVASFIDSQDGKFGIHIDDLMSINFIETSEPKIVGSLTPLRNVIPPDRVKAATSAMTIDFIVNGEVENSQGETQNRKISGTDRVNVYFSERDDLCD